MIVRSKQLQSETGYIDARPLTTTRRKLLQRTAGPYRWVNLVILTVWHSLPIYPGKQTSSQPVGMPQRCQNGLLPAHSSARPTAGPNTGGPSAHGDFPPCFRPALGLAIGTSGALWRHPFGYEFSAPFFLRCA